MVDEMHEYIGAVHLHSNVSDGSLPIPEIAEIAGSKSLDFLMFTDHNTLEPKRAGLEGWYGQVLVLIGYEINDRDDKNHYLAFRLDNEVEGSTAAEYVSRVRERGGLGIIAHPAEKRNFSEAYPPYPWTDWDVQGFDGIEIWNQLSEWMEGITRANMFWRIWHPLRSIRFPEWDILRRWDRLNLDRRVIGIGGIDVHAFSIKILGFIPVEIYPYKVQFKSIRTHILSDKQICGSQGCLPFEEAETALFAALEKGCCFVSNYSLGDARGFRFRALQAGDLYEMGSRIEGGGSVRFEAHVPAKAKIRLLQNGRLVQKVSGDKMGLTTAEPGVYRIEVFKKGRGWIYSNPIVLTGRKDH